MANSTKKIFDTIGVIDTFVENFPMSILDFLRGKGYSSVLEFVLDLLKYLKVDTDEIINRILSGVFGSTTAKKLATVMAQVKYNMNEDVMYERLEELGDIETPFIDKAEDVVKIGIGELLAGLLSCNCIPVIKNKKMDMIAGKPGFGYVSIPVSSFDMFNKLSICPTTSTGSCFYQMETENEYMEIPSYAIPTAKTQDVKTVSSIPAPTTDSPEYICYNQRYFKKSKKSSFNTTNLYKTEDLDAFIWYVLNRGVSHPQIELNKMMWDNRLTIKKNNQYNEAAGYNNIGNRDSHLLSIIDIPRKTVKEWNYWLNSKEDSNGVLFYSGQTGVYVNELGETGDTGEPGYNPNSPLYPIMQLEREDEIVDERRLRVYISAQRYYLNGKYYWNTNINRAEEIVLGDLMPNHTMYKFNYDYMKSIKIFSVQQILASMIKFLYGGSLNGTISVNLSIRERIIQEKLKTIISNILTADDTNSENCFYTFSNESYDRLLHEYELEKYNAVNLGNGSFAEKTVSEDYLIDSINSAMSDSNRTGTVSNITKTLQQITTVDDGTEGSNTVSVRVGLNGMSLLETLLMGILYPFAEGLLSPKVVLLIMINLDAAGIINIEEMSLKDRDVLVEFIWNKIIAMLSYLIIIIKDMIVEILIDLFNEYVKPLFSKYMLLLLQEQVNNWIEVLNEALQCIPMFEFNFKKYKTQIAEISYADINQTNELNGPESTTEC